MADPKSAKKPRVQKLKAEKPPIGDCQSVAMLTSNKYSVAELREYLTSQGFNNKGNATQLISRISGLLFPTEEALPIRDPRTKEDTLLGKIPNELYQLIYMYRKAPADERGAVKSYDFQKKIGVGLLENPTSVAIDRFGNVVVADQGLKSLQVYEDFIIKPQHLRAIKLPPPAEFSAPRGVAFTPDGSLCVLDTAHIHILGYPFTKLIRTIDLSKHDPTMNAYGITVNLVGTIAVSDKKNHKIELFNSTTGDWIKTVGSKGYNLGQVIEPAFMTTDLEGNFVVVEEKPAERIQYFSPSGDAIKEDSFEKVKQLKSVAFDSQGHILACSFQRISVFGPTGMYLAGFGAPGTGICIDKEGNFVGADPHYKRLKSFGKRTYVRKEDSATMPTSLGLGQEFLEASDEDEELMSRRPKPDISKYQYRFLEDGDSV